jgi:hypothetical protein
MSLLGESCTFLFGQLLGYPPPPGMLAATTASCAPISVQKQAQLAHYCPLALSAVSITGASAWAGRAVVSRTPHRMTMMFMPMACIDYLRLRHRWHGFSCARCTACHSWRAIGLRRAGGRQFPGADLGGPLVIRILSPRRLSGCPPPCFLQLACQS